MDLRIRRQPLDIPGHQRSHQVVREYDGVQEDSKLDNAMYLSDVVVDGTVFNRGEQIEQRWTVRNTGNTTWDETFQLAFERGDRLADTTVIALPVTPPGADAVLPLTFRAPQIPGLYRSYWRLRNPAGQWFGHRLWVEIQVRPAEQPLRVASGNKLGFYLHMSTDQYGMWDGVRRLQPPVLLIHADTANDMLLNEIRAFRAPDAFVIGRWYIPNDEQRAMLESSDPAGEGRRLAEQIIHHDFGKFTRRGANGRLLIDAWMSLNETLPGPASGSYQDNPADYHRLYAAYDQFQIAFRARLVEAGMDAVAFNFAAGNFTQPEHYLDFFPKTLTTYTYLGFHEYGWPALMPGAGVHTSACLYRDVMAGIHKRHGTKHRIIITEAGLTRAYGHPQNPDEGWLNDAEPLTQDRYWESLAWYNQQLVQDEFVLGACLYEVGHHGGWASFRHLGQNNRGQPLNLIERMVALYQAAQASASREDSVTDGLAVGPTVGQTVAVQGESTLTVIRGHVEIEAQPAASAGMIVRLHGDLETLGAVRGAVIGYPGAYTWTRAVTGFSGTIRTAWDRFVAGEVAGLTWFEFREQVMLLNPALASSAGRFVADAQYLLPMTTATTPAIVWDRTVTGYTGTLYQAWLDLLQGKVVGLDYAAFRRQFAAYNPHWQGQPPLQAEAHYRLPRTIGAKRYHLTTVTNQQGEFCFDTVPTGTYQLQVIGTDLQQVTQAIVAPQTCHVNLTMSSVAPLSSGATASTLTTDGATPPTERTTPTRYPTMYAQYYTNLRRTPGYLFKPEDHVIGLIVPGTQLHLFGFPEEADGLVWWHVQVALNNGMVAVGWVAQATAYGVQLLDVKPPSFPDRKIDGKTGGKTGEKDDGQDRPLTKQPDEPDVAPPDKDDHIDTQLTNTQIVLAKPFVGNWRITQGWGERPHFYQQFRYNGVPLKGHNGLDYGTPVGTELLATAGGTVKWVGYDETGFGHYVLLQHSWGESVYAHLSRIDVAVGSKVSAGTFIGLSGNSGNSSGPHLHFSIRVNPYRRDDGWGGYVDPTPWLWH